MTEAEWLASDDPREMLEFLRGKTTRRKMILFCLWWCPLYRMERVGENR
jgi:hypothetical protein